MAVKKTLKPNKREKGEGSIYPFRNGFAASLELPSPDGKRRRKVVTGKTENIVKEKLKVQRRQLLKDGDLPTNGQTLESWLNVWFETIALKKIRKRTAETYRSKINEYIIPSIGKVQLNKLTPAHVRRMHDYITVEKKLSPTSAHQSHRILSVALKYAEREGRVAKNVANLTDTPTRDKPKMKALTVDEAKAVIRTVAADRLGTRIAAALFTGARQGELLGVELDRIICSPETGEPQFIDVSWQLQRFAWEHGCRNRCGRKKASDCPDRKITLPSGSESRRLDGGLWLSRPKTEKSMRVLSLAGGLGPVIANRMAAAMNEPNPHGLLWTSDPKTAKGGRPDSRAVLPLDGSPIDPSWDSKYWHKALERAGVPDVRLHDARHTTASIMLNANTPEKIMMETLGHSSYITTMGYQHVNRAQRDLAALAVGSQLSDD